MESYHMAFCVWLLSLSKVFSRLVLVLGVSEFHSFLLLSNIPLPESALSPYSLIS